MDYRSSTSNFFASPLEGHVDLNACLENCHQIAQDYQYISFIISVVLRCGTRNWCQRVYIDKMIHVVCLNKGRSISLQS